MNDPPAVGGAFKTDRGSRIEPDDLRFRGAAHQSRDQFSHERLVTRDERVLFPALHFRGEGFDRIARIDSRTRFDPSARSAGRGVLS